MTKRKSFILRSVGLFVLAIAQILSHYIALPDLVKGLLMGVGIGIVLISLKFGNFKAAQ